MSEEAEKKVQVSVPMSIYIEAKTKLIKNDKTWQDLLLGKIKKYVEPNKKMKKKKKGKK